MRLGMRKINAWVKEAQEQLGLHDWKITVKKGDAGRKGGENVAGLCDFHLAEKRAHITIDPEHIDGEESAMDTCYHEVAHLAVAALDDYTNEMAHKLYPRNAAARQEALDSYDRLREELVVRMVGQMMKRRRNHG